MQFILMIIFTLFLSFVSFKLIDNCLISNEKEIIRNFSLFKQDFFKAFFSYLLVLGFFILRLCNRWSNHEKYVFSTYMFIFINTFVFSSALLILDFIWLNYLAILVLAIPFYSFIFYILFSGKNVK